MGRKYFPRALTISNIMAGFKRTAIWPLNRDALINNMKPRKTFQINGQEDACVVQKHA